jgi:hypothetical protein
MIEIESVAPSTTPELPEIPMAHLKESHNSEYEMQVDKSVESQRDEIVKNIDAAHDVIINELPDKEEVVAGIPVTLTLDCSIEEGYVNYSVAVYFTIEGNRIQANLESDSPQSMFSNRLDETVVKELYDYIRSPDLKKEIDVRNKATERLRIANEAKMIHVQSSFKGFEGIMIPYGYRFGECFAYKVKTYTKTDNTGKEVEEEKLTQIGNCCAVTTRFRVDGDTKVMIRIRFITVNGDIKDVDVEVGALNDLRTFNEFARAHGLYIRNAPDFKYMLDEQFEKGVSSGKLPIIEATETIGWYGDAFVCGAECYGGNIICVNAEAREKWYKEGTLEGWMEGIKGLVNIPEVRLAMGLEVATMILQHIGVSSFSVVLDGKTSQLKTIRFKAALSMLGNPNRILIDFNSSNQAPNQILKGKNGVMILIDEIRNADDAKRTEPLIKNVSTGKNRTRFNYRKGINESGEFSTIVCFSSEKEIFGVATYSGTLVRCINLKADGSIPYIKKEVKAFEEMVAAKNPRDLGPKNFGHLGPLVYEVIMKHDDLRADFDAIKSQFEPTTAIENRIADMQAATALGMELLEEVFDGIRGAYPWLMRMDSIQVVKDQTAEYVNESTVPEWVEQLHLLLSNADHNRRYLEEDPEIEVDKDGNETESVKGGTFQVKGYLHESRKHGMMLLLNKESTDSFLKKNEIVASSMFRQIKTESDIIVYEGTGLTIRNPIKNSILGTRVYAIILDKLEQNEWFRSNEEEVDFDKAELVKAITARESETKSLLGDFYKNMGGKFTLGDKLPAYEEHLLKNPVDFVNWHQKFGHTLQESEQKYNELTSAINLKKQQLDFFNEFSRDKMKNWYPTVEIFWKKHKELTK